ncbi:hypothetical protein CPLU01_15702 [Colletotrichum plurivorum]|uniref:Uncharacterized protein n=1 Tax=Colletotrichum plurivorum TaxID=2175906 RepID=A0A8H6J808_9PEZI|nr:hypothetical protein CPLU01_15702 [Colletotrichum plurivorum]
MLRSTAICARRQANAAVLAKLALLAFLALVHLGLDGILLSPRCGSDGLLTVELDATRLADHLGRFPTQRITLPSALAGGLPSNLTIDTLNACLGYPHERQCLAIADLGPQFHAYRTVGMDTIGLKVERILAPEYIVLADAASALLLFCSCSFSVVFGARTTASRWFMALATLLMTPGAFLVVFVYALRSIVANLGVEAEIEIGGAFGVIDNIFCSGGVGPQLVWLSSSPS